MTAKQAQTTPAFPTEAERFDTEQDFYEHLQERAELELRLDMFHRTPARFDNDSWSY